MYPTLLQSGIAATALKILIFPTYKSTDFEVHRNWLAITSSLPISEWYVDTTSEWTLDYPPLFAYFERLLAVLARYADSSMLNIKDLGYDSWQTIYFQRATVICTELVLFYALFLFVQGTQANRESGAHAAALSIALSPGLLIIDHVHFQYNGFLYGILILSLVLARHESTMLASAVLFAALLCLKHIYLYLAPAYFIYLLRVYCLSRKSIFRIRFLNATKLAGSVLVVFALAFGPFVYLGQTKQLLSRLFPFSRGLTHAYWAPNIWAMYSWVDRVLILGGSFVSLSGWVFLLIIVPVARIAQYDFDENTANSMTRGLVGDTGFVFLPNVTPQATFYLTLIVQLVCMVKPFMKPTWDNFVGCVTACGFASFLFGWHVHEKAILLVIIPFSLLAPKDRRYLGAYRPLAVAGHVSLFPLLFDAATFPLKVVYTIAWLITFLLAFDRLAPASSQQRVFLLDRFSLLYIAIAIPLMLYSSLVHRLVFGERFEFLPLMFISSYSAIGVFGSWLGFLVVYFTS